MKLPNWLYETMPLIYFALGFICAQIDYGTVSAAMFFLVTLMIHTARYNNRHRANKTYNHNKLQIKTYE